MGAEYDSRMAYGKNANEAFHKVTDEAGWERGHGYSGSLAEKHEFVKVRVPTNPDTGRRMSVAKFESFCLEADLFMTDDELLEEERSARSFYTGAALTNALRNLKQERKERDKFLRKVPVWARDQVLAVGNMNRDKWGPATCVEVLGSEYYKAKRSLPELKGKQGIRIYKFWGYCSS